MRSIFIAVLFAVLLAPSSTVYAENPSCPPGLVDSITAVATQNNIGPALLQQWRFECDPDLDIAANDVAYVLTNTPAFVVKNLLVIARVIEMGNDEDVTVFETKLAAQNPVEGQFAREWRQQVLNARRINKIVLGSATHFWKPAVAGYENKDGKTLELTIVRTPLCESTVNRFTTDGYLASPDYEGALYEALTTRGGQWEDPEVRQKREFEKRCEKR